MEASDDGGLEALLTEAREKASFSPPANPQPSVGAKPPRMRYSHTAMADLVIAHPEWTQNQIADAFGYTAAWVSTIMTSDAFKSHLAERRKEIVDPALMASVEHQFQAVTHRSLAVLQEKLARPSAEIPDQLVLQSLAIASRAAGFGARDQTPPQSPVSVHVHLNDMAANLTRLIRREKSPDALVGGHTTSAINALTQEEFEK